MDSRHYQYLLNALKQSGAGRTIWLEYKEKARWVDLSTANFTRRDLRGYDLSEADLSMAIFREAVLAEADLSDATLSCADLRHADLRNAILDRARLGGANLQEANLSDACLEQGRLAKARLDRAILIGADLSGADLTGASLAGASLKYARLTGARLAGANVEGADLTGALLDDDAPARLFNFEKSKIDDRNYREMRCRVLDFQRGEAGDETSQARLVKMDTRRNARRPVRGDGRTQPPADLPPASPGEAPPEAARPEDAPRPEEARRAAAPSLRDVEPNLATLEGCCQVLEVPPGATMDQIVKAFRAKAKVYHPDMVRHLSPRLQELAAEEFRRLRQAYEFLTRRTTRPLPAGINWPEGLFRSTSPYDYTTGQYEELLRLNPVNTSILYNLAWKYFEDGRYAEARAGFEHVLALNPNDEDAQFNLVIVRLYSELLLPEMGEKS